MSNRAAKIEMNQPDLFGEAELPSPKVQVLNEAAVRNGAKSALDWTRSVSAWSELHCWRRITLIEKCEYFYRIIADDAEAEQFRAACETELARLDATGPRVTDEERADRYNYPNFPTREFAPNWVRRSPSR